MGEDSSGATVGGTEQKVYILRKLPKKEVTLGLLVRGAQVQPVPKMGGPHGAELVPEAPLSKTL